MIKPGWCGKYALCALLLVFPTLLRGAVRVEGAPTDTGFDVGTEAGIRATVSGLSGPVSRYAVFAEIQYAGTTSVTSVQMDQVAEPGPGVVDFATGWPIPPQAPTGIYTVSIRVEDRDAHQTVAVKKLRGFAAYRKLLRISGLEIDKTFYDVGDPIQCGLTIENLSDQELKDLRVEFSNANYPWISLFAAGGKNPNLGLKVVRDHVNVPAHSAVTIPMTTAGTAAFLQGQQRAVMGVGAPVRHEKVPPPEVDMYTVAVWNADRTVLYDMQFTTPAIVRPPDRDLPKPYGRAFTHPYNSDIDYTKYREFYPPGMISPAITVDHSRTLYRPGDKVRIVATLHNTTREAWQDAQFRATLIDATGKSIQTATLASGIDLAPGQKRAVDAEAFLLPESQAAGTYRVELSLAATAGELGKTTTEIAVNHLPASILVVCPHEDDEHSYAGLIRAAVEADIPIHVVILTDGDVGECERYYDKPCGPNEAREFGKVRMEEAREALEHISLTRDKVTILGLPDGGSGEIWFHHIPASNPYLSVYLACDHAPYEDVYKPNLPYARDSVIEALKKIITDLHPALIALPHPDERHVDHRTTNWFVIKACQELLKADRIDPHTIVWGDRAYGAGGFKPAPYKYADVVVHLSGEAAALKQEMGWIYQSQDGNLAEGMKRTYTELRREERHVQIVDWQQHEGWNE
jgi:LmbE family N-acetylglucosaminyl deacetylase